MYKKLGNTFLTTKYSLIFTISGLALMISGVVIGWKILFFIAVFLFAWGLISLLFRPVIFAIGKIENSVNIRTAPQKPIPIEGKNDVFNPSTASFVVEPIPYLHDEWLKMFDDQKTLQNYAGYLDDVKKKSDNLANRAINEFNIDRERIYNQQKDIIRLAFAAKQRIKRINNLPKLDIKIQSIPEYTRMLLPKSPDYLTPEQYARKYSPNFSNAAGALSRAFVTNGVNAQTIGGALIGLAIGAVMAKQLVSKAKRALEDARGTVVGICTQNKNTIEILGLAHQEIVRASIKHYEIFAEIESLNNKLICLPTKSASIDELPLDHQKMVKSLWYWILSAEQISKEQVV